MQWKWKAWLQMPQATVHSSLVADAWSQEMDKLIIGTPLEQTGLQEFFFIRYNPANMGEKISDAVGKKENIGEKRRTLHVSDPYRPQSENR